MTIHEPTAPPTDPTPESVPAPEPEQPAESIADHASQFSPEAQEEAAEAAVLSRDEQQALDKSGKFARHRAGSQRATPEDVQEINRLTKELRTTESEWLKSHPDAVKDSPRITALKRQLRGMQADLAEAAPKKETRVEKPVSAYASSSTATFDGKKPKIEDFQADPEKYPDPLEAWFEAVAEWQWDKKAFDQQQQRSEQAILDAQAQNVTAHNERQAKFVADHPDYPTVVREIYERNIGPILTTAIVTSDNGPAFVYHLAQHPELADELIFLSEGKTLSDASVATMQRRLSQAVNSSTQVASTGSTAGPRSYTPPKPPNPVRTGPVKADTDPPGEGSSIADHARYYDPKRRR